MKLQLSLTQFPTAVPAVVDGTKTSPRLDPKLRSKTGSGFTVKFASEQRSVLNSLQTCFSYAHNLQGKLCAVTKSTLLLVPLLALGVCSGAMAQSGLDNNLLGSKPSLLWLSDDVNVAAIEGLEYESFLGSGELWSDNWGVSAKLLENNNDDVFGMPADSEYFNFDVKRRFGSKDKSNFELGLGWQEFNINQQLQASGPKVSLSGRYSFNDTIQLYGETAYFPELEEQISELSTSAFEVEAGVLYQPIPSVSLKAGYRKFSIDLDDPIVESLGSSSGFLLGTDLSF